MASDKFKEWAKHHGIEELASDCQVNRSTVYGWLNGSIIPSDRNRLLLLALSKRKLKLGDLVDGF